MRLFLTLSSFVVPALCALFSTLSPSVARAGIEACGDIHVEANAQCEVRTGLECTAMCEPVRFKAQCAANLYAMCEGQCSAELSLECVGSCEGRCAGECDPMLGVIDCRGSCFADCEGEATGACGDAECRATAEATCSARCDATCEATPPSANCEVECAGVCEGSCSGQANVDCQIECQAPLYVDCETELSGGCQIDCETGEGALFCDGQYVDHGGNMRECIETLQALLNARVTGYAQGSCEGNQCAGEAGFACTCTAHPEDDIPWLSLLVVGFGLLFRRRHLA